MKWYAAFEARDDLTPYQGEGLGLFALALRFRHDDLETIAANAITDGKNDKKIDILFVDRPQRTAFIIQCYMAKDKFDKSAKLNKASDLHTAISHVFGTSEEALSDAVKAQVLDFRDAVRSNEIDTVFIWYVHNRTEHPSVANELVNVEKSAYAASKAHFPGSDLRISAEEIGQNRFEELYEKSSSVILVDDEIELKTDGGYHISGSGWSCYVTTISGSELFDLYDEHSTDLFSLNVRDYLGVVKKDSNINHNIQMTAAQSPESFWAFNNGITVIVHDFTVTSDTIKTKGFAIVNGAQTTGTIGNLPKPPDGSLKLPARFFKTADADLITRIIRYNNSQNAIEASDFRSTDETQKRLVAEFDALEGVDYLGGRRGQADDAIKRKPNQLPSFTVGQVLSAFHGDPVIAYNEKSRIWIDNDAYQRVFNSKTTAGHIIFCMSLLRAIESRKKALHLKLKNDTDLMETEEEELAFFRSTGSVFFLVYVVSICLEVLLGGGSSDKFGYRLKKDSMRFGIEAWESVLDVFLAFAPTMTEALSAGLKSEKAAREAAVQVRQLVNATKASNREAVEACAKRVVRK